MHDAEVASTLGRFQLHILLATRQSQGLHLKGSVERPHLIYSGVHLWAKISQRGCPCWLGWFSLETLLPWHMTMIAVQCLFCFRYT